MAEEWRCKWGCGESFGTLRRAKWHEKKCPVRKGKAKAAKAAEKKKLMDRSRKRRRK